LLNQSAYQPEHPISAWFSPTGKHLVVAFSNYSARVCDAQTGAPFTGSLRHSGAVLFAAFSSDETRIVTVAADHTVRVWDTRSGKAVTDPLQSNFSQAAHFLQQGQWVASSGIGLRVWDVRTGFPLTGELMGRIPFAGSFAQVDSDGQFYLTLNPDGIAPELTPLMLPHSPVPAWLASWAEAAAGIRIDDRGGVELVSLAEFLKVKQERLDSRETNSYALWAKWFFSAPDSRPVSPYSKESAAAWSTRVNDPERVLRLTPANGLMLAKSARAQLKIRPRAGTSRQHHLARCLLDVELAVKLAPDLTETWQARADLWKELGNLSEALEAANQARKLDPTAPQLWTLNGSLLALTNRLEEALDSLSRAVELAESQGPTAVTNLNSALEQRAHLWMRLGHPSESLVDLGRAKADFLRAKNFPPRKKSADARLLDLTLYYNVTLDESWHYGFGKSDFSSLKPGVASLGGTDFDVRGLIQVGGVSRTLAPYPRKLSGIFVGQRCRRIHFLHAAIYGRESKKGTQIGHYVVHFVDGKTHQIPIVLGRDLDDWFNDPNDSTDSTNIPTIAWTSTNQSSRLQGRSIRLFKTSWETHLEEVPVQSLDFVSDDTDSKPFLLAVTLD
jgi:tetratricopeptide (TPR) repeat protein